MNGAMKRWLVVLFIAAAFVMMQVADHEGECFTDLCVGCTLDCLE